MIYVILTLFISIISLSLYWLKSSINFPARNWFFKAAPVCHIDDLHDFLLVEILCRLPSKESVFQCTCVSKRWCTLISNNPYFVSRFLCLQSYHENKQTTPIVPSLIDGRGRNFPYAKAMPPSSSTKFSAPSKSNNPLLSPVFEEDPIVVGTCNDLVLCCRTELDQREYYICNAYTTQWVALPPTPRCEPRLVPVGFICNPYYYEENGNGTSNSTLKLNKDYRCTVVRVLPHTSSSDSAAFKFNLEIFSSKTCEWRETVVSSSRDVALDMCTGPGVAYNGMLYWHNGAGLIGLNIEGDDDHVPDEFCFFDLVDERVSDERVKSIECTGVHRGCLLFWGWDELGERIICWELEGSAGKLCVKHSEEYSVDTYIAPDKLAISAFVPNTTDGDIVYVCDIDTDEEVMRELPAMYNTRTRQWSIIQSDPNDEDSYIGRHPRLFQLVFSPWWPTPVPRLPLHTHKGTICT